MLKPKELLADVPVCAFAKDLPLFGASLTIFTGNNTVATMSKYVCRVPSRSCLLSFFYTIPIAFLLNFHVLVSPYLHSLTKQTCAAIYIHMYIHVPMYKVRSRRECTLKIYNNFCFQHRITPCLVPKCSGCVQLEAMSTTGHPNKNSYNTHRPTVQANM